MATCSQDVTRNNIRTPSLLTTMLDYMDVCLLHRWVEGALILGFLGYYDVYLKPFRETVRNMILNLQPFHDKITATFPHQILTSGSFFAEVSLHLISAHFRFLTLVTPNFYYFLELVKVYYVSNKTILHFNYLCLFTLLEYTCILIFVPPAAFWGYNITFRTIRRV